MRTELNLQLRFREAGACPQHTPARPERARGTPEARFRQAASSQLLCLCVCVCVCVCVVSKYVCVCVCMYVCIYVCMYVCMYMAICIAQVLMV
jgi:hypothetical protein